MKRGWESKSTENQMTGMNISEKARETRAQERESARVVKRERRWISSGRVNGLVLLLLLVLALLSAVLVLVLAATALVVEAEAAILVRWKDDNRERKGAKS